MDNEFSIRCQIERIQGQIEQTKLYAQWWLTRAHTGEIKSRPILHGDGNPLTDEEQIKDAVNIAHTHIQKLEDLYEIKIELMKKLEEIIINK